MNFKISKGRSSLIFGVTAFFFFGFFLSIQSFSLSSRHLFAVFDEVWFLDLARGVDAVGGIPSSVGQYLTGETMEDYHQPLYFYLLSLLTEGQPTDFTKGKCLSLLLGLMLLAIIMALSRKLLGDAAMLASGALVAFSPVSAELSQKLLVDGLFTLIFVLTVFTTAQARNNNRLWMLTGFLIAIAYLTKGNGYFLFVSVFAVGFMNEGVSFFKKPALYLSIGAFILGSSFFLIRNITVYGAPFHHINNKVFWLDHWEQFFLLRHLPVWDEIGFKWYFSHHTFGDAVARFMKGFGNQVVNMIQLFGIFSFNKITQFLSGLFFLSSTLYGFFVGWRSKAKSLVVSIVSVSGVLFLAFSFFLEQNLRYDYPFFILMAPFCGVGLDAIRNKMNLTWSMSQKKYLVGSLFLFLASVGYASMNKTILSRNPLDFWHVPQNWKKTGLWLNQTADEKGYVTSNWSYFSEWYCCRDKRRQFIFNTPKPTFQTFLDKTEVDLILLDQKLLPFDTYKEKYGPVDEFGPTSFMERPRCFHSDEAPSQYLVYGNTCKS